MLSGSVLAVSLFFSQIMMTVQLYKYSVQSAPHDCRHRLGLGCWEQVLLRVMGFTLKNTDGSLLNIQHIL